MMKNKIIHSNLLVHYKDLFTRKQLSYMKDYFFNDLSYSEIAKKNGVSSMAVCDTIKRCRQTLAQYEKKLQLHQKYVARNKLIKKVRPGKLRAEFEKIEEVKNETR